MKFGCAVLCGVLLPTWRQKIIYLNSGIETEECGFPARGPASDVAETQTNFPAHPPTCFAKKITLWGTGGILISRRSPNYPRGPLKSRRTGAAALIKGRHEQAVESPRNCRPVRNNTQLTQDVEIDGLHGRFADSVRSRAEVRPRLVPRRLLYGYARAFSALLPRWQHVILLDKRKSLFTGKT